MISVPKRIVPSAPVRNAIKRVVREAFRLARMQHAAPPAGTPADGLATDGRVVWPGCLIRLHALPCTEMPVLPDPVPPTRKQAKARKPRPFDVRLPDGALKRACREDADRLLARFVSRLARPVEGGPRP